jgi:hypothetical protein
MAPRSTGAVATGNALAPALTRMFMSIAGFVLDTLA